MEAKQKKVENYAYKWYTIRSFMTGIIDQNYINFQYQPWPSLATSNDSNSWNIMLVNDCHDKV